MRKAKVFNNETLAGMLLENENGYEFIYDDFYFLDNTKPAISLTISKKIYKKVKYILSSVQWLTMEKEPIGYRPKNKFATLILVTIC